MDTRILFTILLLAVTVPAALSKVLQPAHEAALVAEVEAKNPRALYLGMIDGKGFFVDNSTRVSWTDAKALCTAAGLRLAEIRNANQHTFLLQKLLPRAASPSYWTGARDAQTESQLTWDGSGTTVNRYGTGVTAAPICTAAVFYISPSNTAYFILRPIVNTYHVLCETP